jgi:hypothetical protein
VAHQNARKRNQSCLANNLLQQLQLLIKVQEVPQKHSRKEALINMLQAIFLVKARVQLDNLPEKESEESLSSSLLID